MISWATKAMLVVGAWRRPHPQQQRHRHSQSHQPRHPGMAVERTKTG
jgi:hypothetical protein